MTGFELAAWAVGALAALVLVVSVRHGEKFVHRNPSTDPGPRWTDLQ